MKFIHAADLHIDSPLRGLAQYEGAPCERLRGATREAFANLVSLAIDQRVDFVVIAGDLFDGPWQDMQTGIWTANQFRRLRREQIDVYLLHGNHDAASRVERSIQWPSNVHTFATERAETIILENLGVALHGQGFGHREVPADLVPGYPAPVSGLFNIGVLHTSLTGDPDHDTYAPTTEEALVARGYHYWALGHIHGRRTLRERPYIVFAGNTQGRHIREQGAKGCLVVTVLDGEIESAQFHATDTLRWQQIEIQCEEDDNVVILVDRTRQRLAQCHHEADGRFCAVRVVLRGRCVAHRVLAGKAEREHLVAEIRNLANDLDHEVWVEHVEVETSPLLDLDQLRLGTDLIGDLLQHTHRLAAGDAELAALARELDVLSDRAAAELQGAGIDLADTEQLGRWLRQAESLLVSQLLESET